MKKVIEPIIASIGFFAIALLYLAGKGYQTGSLELGGAFALLRYSAIGGMVGAALVVFWLLWQRPSGFRVAVLFVSAVLGITAFALPYRQMMVAQQVPPIHDITTDTENPPQFIAVAPLRADAPNSIEYAGPEVAAMQREAYPDLFTMVYTQSSDEVFEAVVSVTRELGWELVDVNEAQGRIEATDTTKWFGFKDDVVIRLRTGDADSTNVDVRSKSRVGRSDVGANAARIRAFRDALNSRLN